MQRLLVIIPCYNEEKRLDQLAFRNFLQSEQSISFLFVNDGSSDNTFSVLEKLQHEFPEHVDLLNLEVNVGKAEAIRQGMLSASNSDDQFLAYFDADLATPLSELPRLVLYIKEDSKPYLVMGSRIKLLGSTNIQRKLRRHYIGRVFATIVSNMLKLPIYDTQCGAKMMRKEVVSRLFEKPFISKWLFDVELLFRLKRSYPDYETRIIEVPLKRWEDVAGSKISFSYFLRAPLDLLRIYLKYR